jgi:hypothetical protein
LTLFLLKRNAVLGSLSKSALAEVIADGKIVTTETPGPIHTPGRAIREVYFPIDAVFSVARRTSDGSVWIGSVGREGVSAIPLLLGATVSANEVCCQVSGRSMVISSARFIKLMNAGNREFRSTRKRFLRAYVTMAEQIAACIATHSAYERIARWLLMTMDRIGSERISLTQDLLPLARGSHIPTLKTAAEVLETERLVSYAPGRIVILDRPGLERAACECYAIARQHLGPLLRT